VGIKITVVVPVFNPGRHIESLVDSLAEQTLPPEEFEVVFVDDGSTDETPARLDQIARERPNVRVIHQENSGWPGKPRNVGVEAARGDYVFFCDNDDWLGPEALERLHAMARREDADIVIGKMIGHNRGVPRVLFERNVRRATLADTPLIDSLTPHKLFRKAFLDAHQIRFPEGRRRLEDHVFVVRAYFLAKVICVLADYACYHHIRRDDLTNAGFTPIEPNSYYGYVREVLDVVDEHTDAGAFRDGLYRRFLRQELLGRLDGARLLRYDPDYRDAVYGNVRALVLERFPTTVDAGLSGRQRLLAGAVRAGALADVLLLAAWSSDVESGSRLRGLGWQGEELALSWEVRLSAPGRWVAYDGSRLLLQTPPGTTAADPVDITDELNGARAHLVARHRDGGEELVVPTIFHVSVDPAGAVLVSGTSTISPEQASFGSAMSRGIWVFFVRIAMFGWSLNIRVGADRDPAAAAGCLPAVVGDPARVALPYWTEPHGNLALELDGAVQRLQPLLSLPDGTASARAENRALVATVALPVSSARVATVRVRFKQRGGSDRVDASASLQPSGKGTTLVTDPIPLRGPAALRAGSYDMLLLRRDAARGVGLGVEVHVTRFARATVRRTASLAQQPAAQVTAWGVLVHGFRWRLRRGVRRIARAGGGGR